MTIARILTQWTAGSGGTPATGKRPRIALDFNLASWTDVTAQSSQHLPPSPNLFVVEVTCTNKVTQQIKDSLSYGPGAILWEDTGKYSPMSDTEFGKLRAYLATHGLSTNDINLAVGTAALKRTRTAICNSLASWLRNRPKA